MDKDRWKIVEGLFHQIVDVGQGEQQAWLEEHCSDPVLRADVMSVLQGDLAGDTPANSVRQAIAEFSDNSLPPWVDDLSGKTIGAYLLKRQIGVGGMGTVYLAERSDGTYEQQVAIKLLNPAMLTAHTRQRFLAERQILADLDHPNIARLLDGGETHEGLPYLVLTYVEGSQIDAYCSKNDLSIEERCSLFVSVCDAVQFAHAHLIVHRDLKPSNILVSPQGTPKLLDFGIAKLLQADSQAQVTKSIYGQPMTPQYASPEQRLGETVTTASDIYSLGILLYQLLAGELPTILRGTAVMDDSISVPPSATQSSHDDRNVKLRRHARRQELHGDLDNIVMMAIRHEPERRYASAAAFAEDVRRYLSHEPVAARADSWSYRTGKFVRRHRLGLAVTMLMVVSLIVTVMFFTNRLAEERDLAALEAEKARQISSFLVNIFKTADPVKKESGVLTAVDLLDEALIAIGAELAEDPETRGYLLTVMSESYRELGQFDKALIVAQQSVAAYRATEPIPKRALARSLVLEGIVHRLYGNYEAALVPTLEAWELSKQEANQSTGLESWVSNSLGLLYKELGQYDLAREILQTTIQLSIETFGEIHFETADAMNNFAITLQQMGDYRLASEYACLAAEIGEQTLTRLHSNLAAFINNCGRALQLLGHFDEASIKMKESLSRRIELIGEHGFTTLFPYLALSDLYRLWGQYDLSLEYLEHARISIHNNLAIDAPEWGRYYHALGQLQFSRGDSEVALESLDRARDMYLKSMRPDHLTLKLIAILQARALISIDREEPAAALILDAELFLGKRFDDNNILKYELQLALADLAVTQQKRTDAKRHLLSALSNCENNIGIASWCSVEPLAALKELGL